ncbi:MAG: VOC family protein [Gammaproteobacteria bacterium]|nr:VOC family protein [Gammaproteobacteria bacterium]MDH5344686.1 VOC family protein [Gammaproteobacteria bacterium]
MLGKFLEISVHTPDILESLGFYKLLGFRELEVRDTWPHRYTVISDGELNIGLHDLPADEGPVLTFVHSQVAKEARAMADLGFEFETLHIDEDVFNELSFRSPDGHRIRMIEARTFSKADERAVDSLCGSFVELSLPVRDAMRAGRFWAPLAPEVLRVREEPTTHMRFNAAGLSLGLSESIALNGPALAFRCSDREAVWIALARHGFEHKEFPGYEGAFMVVTAPEGTDLFLFEEDFLGELYEVEETDEPTPAG